MDLRLSLTLLLLGGLHPQFNAQGATEYQSQTQHGRPKVVKQPNIIWIMADDAGLGEVEPFAQNSSLRTPALARMASEGLRFTSSYTGYSVCGPSRMSFFTGRNAGAFARDSIPAWIHPDDRRMVLPSMLKEAGYQTAMFGKGAPFAQPCHHGFDEFVGETNQLKNHNMYPLHLSACFGERDPNKRQFWLAGNRGNPVSRKACMAHPELYNFTTDVFHEQALKWLRKTSREKPFFLYMSHVLPHAGTWGSNAQDGSPIPVCEPFCDKPWTQAHRDHAASIAYLDRTVGELLEAVKSMGIDNNTVVFFASDNGHHHEGGVDVNFFNAAAGLRGHKRSLYEGGVRSPTIVRWPGVIAPDSVSSHAWTFEDVYPTLAELAGHATSTTASGVSIVPTLLGLQQRRKEYIYFTWGRNNTRHRWGGYSIRHGRWKGVVWRCGENGTYEPSYTDKMQLYDLTTDPFEWKNVVDKHPQIQQRLVSLARRDRLSCHCYQCDIGDY